MGFLFGGAQTTKPQAKTKPSYTGLQTQTSAFGGVIPIIFGATRIAPNLVWYGDFLAISHKTKTKSGGKGGGSADTSTVSYTYQTAVAMGLCEGPITGIGLIWKAKALTTLAAEGFTLFLGTAGQSPWGYLTTNHPGQDLAYMDTAYVAAAVLDLGGSADLPNYNMEIFGFRQNAIAGSPDANPALIITDVLTSTQFGAGFPSAQLANLNPGTAASYGNWCRAAGLVMSPSLTEQKTAAEIVQEICDLTISAPAWNGGVLTIVPLPEYPITANGFTYTPNLTPIYDLTDDDYLPDAGNDPVVLTRARPADAFNAIKLEYLARANAYNTEIVEVKDQAQIDLYGPRPMSTIQAHHFCLTSAAQMSAQQQLIRQRYRNTYAFNVGWGKILLDPGDIVTLTDSVLGLDQQPARILAIQEDDQGRLAMTCEELLRNTDANAIFAAPVGTRYSVDYNAPPGPANAPLIFEPPLPLLSTGKAIEVWVAISGGTTWGGSDCWVSYDGNTYLKIEHIDGGSNMGTLRSTLPTIAAAASGNTIDQTNTLQVDLTVSRGEMLSGTTADAIAGNTICYVDGELISYVTATLVGSHKYDLTFLVRGQDGTTIGAHASGSRFARLDQAIAKIPVSTDRIGQTIYIKFPAFNIFGGGQEDISDVPAYTYKITGGALTGVLPAVTMVTTNFVAGIMRLRWTGVTDPRSPIDYEVRKGPSWQNSQVMGRTPLLELPVSGDGTYWVSAHYRAPTGIDVYSVTQPSVDIIGSVLTSNVIQTWDEGSTGWTGTVSGGAAIVAGSVELVGSGDILAAADVLAIPDVLYYGGIAASGIYQAPDAHIVALAAVASCQVLMNWTIFGVSSSGGFLTVADFLGNPDFLGSQFNAEVAAQPQVALSLDGTTYGAWQNWSPGTYTFKSIKARIVLTTNNSAVIAILTAWSWSVDVPDLVVHQENIAIGTGGSTITFPAPAPFNAVPNVSVTVLDHVAGDIDILPVANITATGFFIQVKNGGVGVARAINFVAQGF